MNSTLLSRQLPLWFVYLLLAVGCFACFGVLAYQVDTSGSITTFDVEHADRMHTFAQSWDSLYNLALLVTDLGSGQPHTIVIVSVTILLLLGRQWRLALFWAITQYLVKDIAAFAKNSFERPRPEFPEVGLIASGWAFPSGHATGAMATYGMIAFLAARQWPDRWFRWPIIAGCCLIVLAVGLSRMLLGLHWFTDVLGGYLLALAYISLCLAAIEGINPRARP